MGGPAVACAVGTLPWCLGGRALLTQLPGAEQGAGEDAGGPPERGVVAVCHVKPVRAWRPISRAKARCARSIKWTPASWAGC